jgi:EpsI family protein
MSDRTPRDAAPRLSRRQVVLGASLLATAGIAKAREPRTHVDFLGKRKLEDIVPKRFGNYEFFSSSGLVTPPEDQLKDQLYSQLLTRVYVAPDAPPMMLLVAQSSGQTGVLQVHRPEICYPVGGFRLSNSQQHIVPLAEGGLPTVFFTATSDDRIEQLMYWTRVGNDMPESWPEQRWAVAKANLMGLIPDAVMVRVSTITPDREQALARLNDFTRAFLGAVPANARAVFDNLDRS